MPGPKWKQFELLVAKIQADLAGAEGIVTPNDKIMGKTGIFRQIDISIKSNVGQFQILVVIDCKDYNHPLDITDVEAFVSMAQDVQAHRAAMVAAHGYSEAARERAKAAQIELYTVVDTGDHPWHRDVSVPALYRYATITEIGIEQTLNPLSEAFKALESFDFVFEAAGATAALLSGIERAAPRAILTIVGREVKDTVIPLAAFERLMRKELTLHGCWGYDLRDDAGLVYQALEQGQLTFTPMITHRLDLAEGPKFIEGMWNKSFFFCKAMFVL